MNKREKKEWVCAYNWEYCLTFYICFCIELSKNKMRKKEKRNVNYDNLIFYFYWFEKCEHTHAHSLIHSFTYRERKIKKTKFRILIGWLKKTN